MKNIILLPRIVDNLKTVYDEMNEPLTDIPSILKKDFCPNNRGLLYFEEGNYIKIWSKHVALVCVGANEKDSLKVISIKAVKDFQYHFILERGKILTGDWTFVMPNDTRRLQKNDHSQNESSMRFIEDELRKNSEDSFSIDDGVAFAKYIAYWENHDIVKKYQEEALFERKIASIAQFNRFTIDFDKELIKVQLNEGSSDYKLDENIVIASEDVWQRRYQLDNGHLKTLRGFNLGRVSKYHKGNRILIIHSNSSTIQNLMEDKRLKSGYLWVDDIGSKSKLRRESEALKTLFRGESVNKQLKNFIPEIASIKNPVVNEQVKFELLSDGFHQFKDKQKEAVLGALNCSDIYLIQGPPGTGKTTVISEIIQYLVNDNKKILLSSQTNLAVDNVLQRIGQKENVRAIRIGPKEKFELDSIQYSLEHRVEDLQNKMTTTLKERPNHFRLVKEMMKNSTTLLEAHRYVQIEIKPMINIKKNLITYDEMLAQTINEENHLRNKLDEQKHVAQLQHTAIGKHSDVLEQLHKIQQHSTNTLKENIMSADIMDEIYLSDEDTYNVRIYKGLVNEIQVIISEVKKLKEDRANSISLMEQIVNDMQYTYSRIEGLESQRPGLSEQMQTYLMRDVNNFKLTIEDLKVDLHEKKYQLTKLDEKISNLNVKALNLRNLALEIKGVIEQTIAQNLHIWEKYFDTSTITKEKFVDLWSRIDSFKDEFASVIQHTQLLTKLDDFSKISSVQAELVELQQMLDALEIEKKKNQKYVSKFKESLVNYMQNDQLKLYMAHYGMQFDQLEIEQELSRTKTFISTYKRNVEELELYESTLDIQEEWKQKLEYYQQSFEDIYINTSNLICATCLGIASTTNNHFLNTEFDYVILDEAARASSMELLIPLIRGKKIVLVGDHKQISPTLERDILEKLERDNVVNTAEINSVYKKSLFGLMYEDAHDQLKTFLNKQFRMNPDISHVVSKYYYDGKLLDGENVHDKKHTLETHLAKAFYWIDTPSTPQFFEKKESTSFYNEGEIQTIIAILEWLNNKLQVRKSLGVISPYKAQMNKLLEVIDTERYPMLDIEINTVDAFQGREKNIIINSLVRNNKNGTVGHIRQDSRMNVALSRAQELSIYVGNVDFIRNNKSKVVKINSMIDDSEQRNTVIHANDFMKDGETVWS
ncbi:hypothetical protein EVJ20_08090 [Exiguobacterium sp. SH0S1]|uniref:AAA domain-containing protein n=2 Tax=unclassified Exiguobacterium TaxID=2644629 RepID=UPI001039E501|nr:AAA domain-containing protein [Exiguobacterium sp. SH0S1]TCI77908.1 hypothetical protein EVJ20_08090 [Exiguobacterium sp. SH0S1]